MIDKKPEYLVRLFVFAAVLMLAPVSSSSAEESVAEAVLNDCKNELDSYCSKVEPGRGRYAACLFAHNDKLSNQCEEALEEGMEQLYMIMSSVVYVSEQCQFDLDTRCDGVEIGGGQIYQCLSKNRDKLEKKCETALSEAEEDLQ